MKSQPIDNLLFSDTGKFHKYVKETSKKLDLKDFEALTSIVDKVNFLDKNDIQFKPIVTQVSILNTALKRI